MSEILKYKICLEATQSGKTCTNPTVDWIQGEGIAKPCPDCPDNCFEIEVLDTTLGCIEGYLDCGECDSCDPFYFKRCFCNTTADCEDCEICQDGICVPICPDKKCDNGKCVDCLLDTDCPENKECRNGTCKCPVDKPFVNQYGVCIECTSDANCETCETCVDGTCVPTDCGTGACDPATGNCEECVKSSDCAGANECCSNKKCVCCSGYERDENGDCVEAPECKLDSDCDPCETCVNGVCTPVVCPGNTVCNPNTEECEVPCGGNNCVEWDCKSATITGGTTTPGLPALNFNVNFKDLGVIDMDSGQGAFRDYEITVTVANTSVVGTWDVEGSSYGPSNQLKFKLSDNSNVQWNNVGFEIKFADSNSARTGSIVIYNNNWYSPTPASDDESYFENLLTIAADWIVDINSNGTSPTTVGGTTVKGQMKLCPCREGDKIIGSSWINTSGDLTGTLLLDGTGCANAVYSGCGDGYFTITLECDGIITTVDNIRPCYDFNSNDCCDPTQDPSCPSGAPGDPCTTISTENGNIVISEFNYVDTSNGYGLFRAVFQPDSVGLSIADWIRISSTGCWNTTGDMYSAGTNVSFTPPTLQNLFHDIEFLGGDGCVQFGYTCDVFKNACTKIKAQACLSDCDAFTVTIIDEGAGICKALPSMGNNTLVTYSWADSASNTGTAQTFTVPDPNYNITFVTVTATFSSNGVVCEDDDTKTFVTQESCCLFTPSYDCSSGFQVATNCPTLTYNLGGVGPISIGDKIDAGSYLVTATDTATGVTCNVTFVVPQCYICNASNNCVAAATGSNIGPYTDDPNCGGLCDCDIEIDVSQTCSGNKTVLTISASGDTGTYTITVINTDTQEVIVSGTGLGDTGSLLTNALCPGNYTITATGENCNKSRTVSTISNGCFDCNTSTLALNNVVFTCTPRQITFDIDAGECSDLYTVTLLDNLNVPVPGVSQIYNNPGTKTIAIPTYPGDGIYTLQLTDDNGCVRTKNVTFACLIPVMCDILENTLTMVFVDAGPGLGTDVNYTFDLSEGGDTYTISLYKWQTAISGSGNICIGGGTKTLVATNSVTGVTGTNNGSFFGEIPDGDFGCYALSVVQDGDPTCAEEISRELFPAPLPPCSIEVPMILAYNDATEELQINWNLANTSNDVTIDITVWDTGTCGVGSSTSYGGSGYGEDGTALFNIPQITSDQCVTVDVYDTADISCIDSGTITIPSCTCDVTQLLVSYDPVAERMVVFYEVDCPSNPADITVKVEKMVASDCLVLDSLIETRTGLGAGPGVELFDAVTDTDTEQYFKVTVEDTTLGAGCRDTFCFTLPACELCTTQTIELPAMRVDDVDDVDGNTYSMVGPGFVECASPSTVNDNFATDLETLVQAENNCGTATVSWALAPGIVAGSCLSDKRAFGTSPYANPIVFENVEINGTDYPISSLAMIDTAGTYIPANVTAVATHIANALDTEGVAFDIVDVSGIYNLPTGNMTIEIKGVSGAEVIKVTWGVQGATSETTMVNVCETFVPRGSSFGSNGCVIFTVTNSEILWDTAYNAATSRSFDRTLC